MTSSMTGFARFSHQISVAQITYEIRALNHRFLDISMRLAEPVQNFEPLLRAELRQFFARGKFDVTIKFEWHADKNHSLPIDQGMLNHLIEAIDRVAKQMINPAPVSPLELLRWPGILGLEPIDQITLWQDISYGFKQSVAILQGAREVEGQVIKRYLEERIVKIVAISDALQASLPELLCAQQARLQKRCTDASLSLDANRLAQEIVMFAQRSDIAEEISRLMSHAAAVRQLLTESAGHGRRLDFLMQELNREANTIGAKSLCAVQTAQVIELKVLIEQMREQIQNIE